MLVQVAWLALLNKWNSDEFISKKLNFMGLSEKSGSPFLNFTTTNNKTIRNLTGEYKKIEPDCREGVRTQLERMKELCKKRNALYEKQNELRG